MVRTRPLKPSTRTSASDLADTPPSDSQTENEALREQLRSLLGSAQRNEQAYRRLQSLEIDLLGSESLPVLLRLLLREAPARCEWDRVSLFLHDPELEIRRLLEQVGAEPAALGDLVFVDRPTRLESLFGRRRGPRLGPFLPGTHADLFAVTDQSLASVALLPLDREGRLFGSYNLGSLRRERFPREAGSDFLRHLAAIVGVCLEMAVTRERLKNLGLTDALTGVNNRRFFDQRLPEEIARAQRAGSAVSCLFIDVDHFKRLNDSYGHQAGDRALRAVAELVRGSLRRSDVLTRYGGEEFAAILPQADLQDATEIAERVRERVAEAHLPVGEAEPVSVSVSIGVATLDAWPPCAEPDGLGAQLIEAADRGVYRAKAAGRNQVVAELLA